MRRLARDLGVADLVHWLGFVPTSDLRGLYRLATGVAIPSRFEAASGPLWEAFAAGTPATCSNVTSLPRQAGDAAIVFDPDDAMPLLMPSNVSGPTPTCEPRWPHRSSSSRRLHMGSHGPEVPRPLSSPNLAFAYDSRRSAPSRACIALMRTSSQSKLLVSLQSAVHGFGSAMGVDLVRYSSNWHSIGRRMRLMRHLRVDLVLDVGANTGQYATELRRYGYVGRIVSFEPQERPFRILHSRAKHDDRWTTVNLALGDVPGQGRLDNVAENSVSSSFLEVGDLMRESEPAAAVATTETVEVVRLDDVIDGYRALRDRQRGSRSTLRATKPG